MYVTLANVAPGRSEKSFKVFLLPRKLRIERFFYSLATIRIKILVTFSGVARLFAITMKLFLGKERGW